MIQETLTSLKDFILQYNTYFRQGFDNVYLDETTGIVEAGKPVFPNDTLGNYFYLRLPSVSTFDYNPVAAISDCSNTPLLVSDVTLVACVLDSDHDRLMANLMNTISSFNANARFTQCRFRSEDVVLAELARMPAEKRTAALARIGKHTIISVTFSLAVNFQLRSVKKADCILDPCKC